MKTLLVYYTRTGTTREAALIVAEALGAEVEEIRERKDRKGILGWIRSAYEGAGEKTPPILPVKKNPGKYDLVVVCTPVWGGRMASPIRSWLADSGLKDMKGGPRIACLATQGGEGQPMVFDNMQEALGRQLDLSIGVVGKQVSSPETRERIDEFIRLLKHG